MSGIKGTEIAGNGDAQCPSHLKRASNGEEI